MSFLCVGRGGWAELPPHAQSGKVSLRWANKNGRSARGDLPLVVERIFRKSEKSYLVVSVAGSDWKSASSSPWERIISMGPSIS